jgi:hypothetical protein
MPSTKPLGKQRRRTIIGTHPWINYQLDLSKAHYKLWVMIGEARSKCEHIAGVPLRPETADRLNWATSVSSNLK